MDVSGLTTVSSIVDDVILELGIDDSHKLKLMRLAERGVVDFVGFHLESVKTILLEVSEDTFTAPLPRDYANFSRIGIFKGGQLQQLSLNNKIQLNRTAACGQTPNNEAPSRAVAGYYGYPYASNYGTYRPAYGYRGGVSEFGEYSINIREWEIQLTKYREDIYLEYVSTGINQNGETNLIEGMREPIIAFIKWKNGEGQNIPLSRLNDLERKYRDEVVRFRQKHQRMSLQEYMDAFYASMSNTATR